MGRQWLSPDLATRWALTLVTYEQSLGPGGPWRN